MKPKAFVAAAPAVREGWEVIIPRRIAAKEIQRVRSLPQVIGWRFFPGAKGKRPFLPLHVLHARRARSGLP